MVQSDLQVVAEAKVDFDADFGQKYGIKKGVLTNEKEGEVYAPVALFLEALDLVCDRLKEKKTPLDRIKGVSGSCQQHGSVYWSKDGERLLSSLTPDQSLVDQLKGAFSNPYAPNWQDHSTQAECDEFDAKLGTPQDLANVTGSAAHHVSIDPGLFCGCGPLCIDSNAALHRHSDNEDQAQVPGYIRTDCSCVSGLVIPCLYASG